MEAVMLSEGLKKLWLSLSYLHPRLRLKTPLLSRPPGGSPPPLDQETQTRMSSVNLSSHVLNLLLSDVLSFQTLGWSHWAVTDQLIFNFVAPKGQIGLAAGRGLKNPRKYLHYKPIQSNSVTVAVIGRGLCGSQTIICLPPPSAPSSGTQGHLLLIRVWWVT